MRIARFGLFSFSLLLTYSLVQAEDAQVQPQVQLTPADINQLAAQYNLTPAVLTDYAESYNFKCPQELDVATLEGVIKNMDDFSELSIMQETHEKEWRDLYVESRAGITCLTDGVVSNAY